MAKKNTKKAKKASAESSSEESGPSSTAPASPVSIDALPGRTADTTFERSVTVSQSRLQKVTVYSDRAESTRTIVINDDNSDEGTRVGPGYVDLTVVGLSHNVDRDSIRLRGLESRGHALILDVSSEVVTKRRDESSPEVTEARDRVKAARRAAAALREERARVDAARSFVESIAATVVSSPASIMSSKKSSSAAGGYSEGAGLSLADAVSNGEAFLDFQSRRLEQCDAERYRIDTQLEEALEKLTEEEKALRKVQASLGEVGRETVSVNVSLYVTSNKEVSLAMTYMTSGASWTSSYDCRVDSHSQTLQMFYYGLVTNNTLESWTDTLLYLSTSEPSVGGNPPRMTTARVEFDDGIDMQYMNNQSNVFMSKAPMQQQQMRSKSSMSKKKKPARRGAPRALVQNYMLSDDARELSVEYSSESDDDFLDEDEGGAGGVGLLTTSVKAGSSGAVTFAIPREQSIPADGKARKVTIAVFELKTAFSYTVVPNKQQVAFLRGAATNTQDFPLLAGPMAVFSDGSFVSTSSLKKVMPGEDLAVFLGSDDGIIVKMKPEESKTAGPSSFLSRAKTERTKRVTTIKNTKPKTCTIHVFDQVPLSSTDRIKVKVVEPAEGTIVKKEDSSVKPDTAKDPQDGRVFLNEFNNLRWTVVLEPGKSKTIPFEYVIECPKDENVKVVD